MNNIDQKIFGGAKIPHRISDPVFRYYDGKYYVAAFGYAVTRSDMTENVYQRPSSWALADIETGEVRYAWLCSKKDFSAAENNVKYSMNDSSLSAPSEEEILAILEKFEQCRKLYVLGSSEFVLLAKQYNESIIAITPKDFKQFYQDLAKTE